VTTNAYIFAWDNTGIEAVIPITQYEQYDRDNTMRILNDQPTIRNPLNSIIQMLIIRAKANPQRHYEIYSVDCNIELDEAWWREQWESDPQGCANLVRERGIKMYSDRADKSKQVIS
jgi:hypothetical protein